MARKNNPYSRAQMRARFRKPRQRRSGSVLWGAVIVLVVVLGVGAVALVRGDSEAGGNVAPLPAAGDRAGDHWHSYLGVNVCGSWVPEWPEFHAVAGSPNVQTGIHSHGDGNVHIHPYSSSEAGNNATLGRFVDNGGGSISSNSIELWDGTRHQGGDTCESGTYEGEEAVFQWTVDGELQEGNPSDHKLENGEIIAVYFLPEGAELTEPPQARERLIAPVDLPPPDGGTEVPAGEVPGGAAPEDVEGASGQPAPTP